MTDYFHPQVIILYLLIDILFIYFAYNTSIDRAILYPIFIVFLLYNIAGLYLLHLDIIESNPSLSKTKIDLTNNSTENIISLASLGVLTLNVVLIIIYGFQIANGMKGNEPARRTPAFRPAAASTNGGARRK